ncbi:DUF3310 domain-containing protein [Litorivivens sp.]|uniref:DUF3310 domain-containing protein n=1 Tax=Litorivivens sp. TaxID=2020868 RepID=UPI00356520DE
MGIKHKPLWRDAPDSASWLFKNLRGEWVWSNKEPSTFLQKEYRYEHEPPSSAIEGSIEVEGSDMVNHPPHYTQGDIECIDAIKAALTPDEFRGYCKGAALKYCWRERHKGGDESLKKAGWYLNKATEVGNEKQTN